MNNVGTNKRRISSALIFIITVVLISGSFPVFADSSFTQSKASGLSSQTETSVTVYVTVSDDGKLLTGNDTNKTLMARVPITVEYFDLKDYGLEEYYRYEADSFENGGGYINANLIKRPTILHCYIKVLEKYYLGGGKLSVGSDAFTIEGAPTSTYITKFWGHDANLMYFADHAYPLMRAGLGATSDYFLLESGMDIDIAMFTDYGFHTDGAFAYFDPVEKSVKVDEEVKLSMKGTTTNATWSGQSSGIGVPMKNEKVFISDNKGKTWIDSGKTTDDSGKISMRFGEAGTYYLSSGPLYNTYKMENGSPCVAPPVSVITVKDNVAVTTEPGINPTKPAIEPTGPGIAKPDKPTGLKVSATSYDSMSITWNKVEDAAGYQVYRSQSKNGSYQSICSTDKTSIKSTGLKTGQNYFYKAVAFRKDGDQLIYGDFSDLAWGKTVLQAPSKPRAKSGKKAVALSWEKSSGASGYVIYRASKNGKYKKIKTIRNGGTQKYKNKKLKKNKRYCYKIKAYRMVDGKAVFSKLTKKLSAKTKK